MPAAAAPDRKSPAGAAPEIASEALWPLWPLIAVLAVAAVGSALILPRLAPATGAAAGAPTTRFVDVTAASGLPDVTPPAAADPDAATSLPGAVAFLDLDGDGRPDLLYLEKPHWPWQTPAAATSAGCAFYHNLGQGRFADATRASGLEAPALPMCLAVGDYLNEGRQDVFMTGIGGNRLYHNLGGGRFEDVTEKAGVRGEPNVWSMGAVWIDLDGDGRLDLVICNYARWPRESDLRSTLLTQRAGPSSGGLSGFAPCFPSVYRNLGGGRFAEIGRTSGLQLLDRQTGFPMAFPLAVTALDANGDGKLDLLFSYQSGPNVLFLNEGGGRFRVWVPRADRREGMSADIAAPVGAAFDRAQASDARFAALRSAGLVFSAEPDEAGKLCRLSNKLGAAVLDYDLDGRLDIVTGGGLAEPSLKSVDFGEPLASWPALLWNGGKVWMRTPPLGASASRMLPRGVAVADGWGDGSLAIAVAVHGGSPRLLRNEIRSRHGWLRVDLVGTLTAHDAGGAIVEVHTPGRVQVQTMAPASGFMAQSESTLTFGLGDDARVSRVVVRWPSGVQQEVKSPGANRQIELTEPFAP